MLRRLFILAALLLVPACSKGTYLEVEFTGTLTNIQRIDFSFTYTAPGKAPETKSQVLKSPSGNNIVLPSSLVLELNSLGAGDITVSGKAYDAAGTMLASASENTTVKHNQVWKVQLPLGPQANDGGTGSDASADGGTKDALADAQGTDGSGGGADACTVMEVKASDSVSAVEQMGSSGETPKADVLWAGSNGSSLYSAWIKFPSRPAATTAPAGTKLSSIHLVMHTADVKGTSFNAQIFSSSATWNSTSNPPPASTASGLTAVSDVFAAPPAANTDVAYPLMTLKAWLDMLALGPVTFVIRNPVGGSPSTSGSLIAYQGATSSSGGGGNVPLLRFRFCPN